METYSNYGNHEIQNNNYKWSYDQN